MRRTKGERGSNELRPGSYLVTPHLPAARRAILDDLNIDWVQMDQETFANEILAPLTQERDRGLSALDARRNDKTSSKALASLADLRTEPQNDLPDFLLGREPTWADLTDGFAVVREFENGLKSEIDLAAPRVVAITGTAGVGKSTTLKRLALQYQAEGKEVVVLSLESGVSLNSVRRSITQRHPGILVIDDVDVLGSSAPGFVTDIADQNMETLILMCLRSTRYEALGIEEWLIEHDVMFQQHTVPSLEDKDIDLLLDALDAANRLGRLKGMSDNERRQVLRHECGRQLLVAMIEATSGADVRDRCAGHELQDVRYSRRGSHCNWRRN
jgi:hypothetical protein